MLFDAAQWNVAVAEECGDVLGAMVFEGAKLGGERIGIPISTDAINPAVAEKLQGYKFHFAEKINNTTYDTLRKTLDEGLKAGEGIPKLRKRIQEIPQFKDRARANMIARTETSRAQHIGQVEAWKKSGVVTGKEWLANQGACPFCQEMNGKIVSLDQDFHEQGTNLALPDGSAALKFDYENVPGPPLHPNCRCTLLSVMVDEGVEGREMSAENESLKKDKERLQAKLVDNEEQLQGQIAQTKGAQNALTKCMDELREERVRSGQLQDTLEMAADSYKLECADHQEDVERLSKRIAELETTRDEINGEFEAYRNVARIEKDELLTEVKAYREALETEAALRERADERNAELKRLLRLFCKVTESALQIPLADPDDIEAMILDAGILANEKLGGKDWQNWQEGDYSVVMGKGIVRPAQEEKEQD